jgi:hypothetical protein
VETALFERHEGVLRLNYEVPPTVRMFYQNPEARVINGGDITLFERMFMAGLQLPFPEIARDFILFLDGCSKPDHAKSLEIPVCLLHPLEASIEEGDEDPPVF